jgi:hypothetical protein
MNKYILSLLNMMRWDKHGQKGIRSQYQSTPKMPDGWQAYWQPQDQPWRTEPEVDEKRQRELGDHMMLKPNIEESIYPFKGMKLGRADIEWLLARHENGNGPVDWSDAKQRLRKGLDLRGANLREANLTHLPLSHLVVGLSADEWRVTTVEQWEQAAIH